MLKKHFASPLHHVVTSCITWFIKHFIIKVALILQKFAKGASRCIMIGVSIVMKTIYYIVGIIFLLYVKKMSNDKLTAVSHTEIIEWAMKLLKQSEANTTVIVETAWSTVLKISLPSGSVYVKQTTPDLFIEVDVIQTCRNLCKITSFLK